MPQSGGRATGCCPNRALQGARDRSSVWRTIRLCSPKIVKPEDCGITFGLQPATFQLAREPNSDATTLAEASTCIHTCWRIYTCRASTFCSSIHIYRSIHTLPYPHSTASTFTTQQLYWPKSSTGAAARWSQAGRYTADFCSVQLSYALTCVAFSCTFLCSFLMHSRHLSSSPMLFSSLVPFLCFQKKFRRSSEEAQNFFKSEEQLENAFFQISPDHRTNNCFSFILLDFTLIFASHFHPTQIASRLSFKLSLYDRLVVPS